MLKKVRDYIMEYRMLQPGERVIVALSGGADSVCLLSVLKELSDRADGLGLELKAVHVHHGLRGGEADRDGAYAGELCGRLGIPFAMVCRDVARYGKEHGLSTEEAGRILRYEALQAEADAWGAAKIALAHHRDDNAETILHHLLRGSGLRGLGGMRPVQGNRIRPLLCVGREEVEAYLKDRQLDWCEDSTNASCAYTRNRIRNQVMPLLKENVNERAVENILQAGEIVAEADAYLEGVARRIWEEEGRVIYDTGGGLNPPGCGGEMPDVTMGIPDQACIPLPVIKDREPIIRIYLYRHMLNLLGGGKKDVTSHHYRLLDRLLEGGTGGRCDLPGGLLAVRGYEDFWIMKKAAVGKMGRNTQKNLYFETFSRQNQGEIPKNQYTKWFDYDRIKGTLSVRNRQPGDYITLAGGGTKTLHRYMIDEKIPRELRDKITVLAEGNHVLWIVGYRIGEYYKITEDTKTILQVTADGGEEHGR